MIISRTPSLTNDYDIMKRFIVLFRDCHWKAYHYQTIPSNYTQFPIVKKRTYNSWLHPITGLLNAPHWFYKWRVIIQKFLKYN